MPKSVSVAIMQPTYFPWLGYFALMMKVDHFVFLDDVQFSKRSWQQRNQIKTPTSSQFLTVPVLSKGKREQLLCDVQIDTSSKYGYLHSSSIKQNYSKCKYFSKYFPLIEKILVERKDDSLLNLNLEVISLFRDILGIKNRVHLSSHLNSKGAKSEYLLSICKELNCNHYVSPPGSSNYLEDALESFRDSKISVSYFSYSHPEYAQLYPPFLQYMSILDLIFNEGNGSIDIICSGMEGI